MTSPPPPARHDDRSPSGERVIRMPAVADPERLFEAFFADRRFGFWLDAGAGAGAGYSYLGTGDELVVQGDPSALGDSAGVTVVERVDDAFRRAWSAAPPSDADRSPRPSVGAFVPGWVGFFGYEWRAAGASTVVGATDADAAALASADVRATATAAGERAAARKNGVPPHPDAAWLSVTRLIAIDHATGDLSASWRDDADGATWAAEVERFVTAQNLPAQNIAAHNPPSRHVATTVSLPPADADAPRPAVTGSSDIPRASTRVAAEASWRFCRDAYRALVERCRVTIERGDAYQLCLTNRIDVPGAHDAGDALDLFRTLRRTSPTHRGGLLRFGDLALVSASPEKFLGLDAAGRIEVRPIKGTRPRSGDAATDRSLAAELHASPKERAENLMIVDLMRNDVGRVSALGSVRVDALFDVESYAHVHQLVSTVSGRLAAGLDAVDVLASAFPAGSMTGAPKQSAIHELAALEGHRRGLYSGVFGLIGADQTLDLSMVIRSIVLDAAGASVGAGGGITWSSDPDAEVDEMVLKAGALLAALGARPHPNV